MECTRCGKKADRRHDLSLTISVDNKFKEGLIFNMPICDDCLGEGKEMVGNMLNDAKKDFEDFTDVIIDSLKPE